jgi:eukaryotic-like serine/threonine-protein kinase
VLNAVFDPSGACVLTAFGDNTARLCDAATGTEITVLRGHEGSVLSTAFDPSGRRVLTGSRDNTARLWDAATGTEISVLRGHKHAVFSAVFDASGVRIPTIRREYGIARPISAKSALAARCG